jgi:hypothetical protein
LSAGYDQQDAHEFLIALLDGFDTHIVKNHTKPPSRIQPSGVSSLVALQTSEQVTSTDLTAVAPKNDYNGLTTESNYGKTQQNDNYSPRNNQENEVGNNQNVNHAKTRTESDLLDAWLVQYSSKDRHVEAICGLGCPADEELRNIDSMIEAFIEELADSIEEDVGGSNNPPTVTQSLRDGRSEAEYKDSEEDNEDNMSVASSTVTTMTCATTLTNATSNTDYSSGTRASPNRQAVTMANTFANTLTGPHENSTEPASITHSDAETTEHLRYSSSLNSSIHSLFAGQMSSSLRCQQCGHTNSKDELFLDISLSITTSKKSSGSTSSSGGSASHDSSLYGTAAVDDDEKACQNPCVSPAGDGVVDEVVHPLATEATAPAKPNRTGKTLANGVLLTDCLREYTAEEMLTGYVVRSTDIS